MAQTVALKVNFTYSGLTLDNNVLEDKDLTVGLLTGFIAGDH
jgi:hypothetical protein